MHTAFALLQVNRVRREVPVHDGVAVGVEVQTLLPDGSRREYEGPERRVKGLAQLPRARDLGAVVGPFLPEAEREVAPHPVTVELDLMTARVHDHLVHAQARGPYSERLAHRPGNVGSHLSWRFIEQPLRLPQRVRVLVKNSL